MPETKRLTGLTEVSLERTAEILKEIKNVKDYEKRVKLALYKSTTELLEVILAGAFYLDASDIHIEPKETEAKLRLRIDGVLHDILFFAPKIYKPLLSRVKLLSKLKLNVTSRPQDGRFSILLEDSAIEVRASSLPSEYGEALVLRILNPKWVVDMEDLGLREDLHHVFMKETGRPNGMIICTGPTGSGKTTTLYAFLQKINRPEIKIITIEDPIEYHLKGVSQSQVDESKGYTFASGLRAIVRQDPDVILVGEIRDQETAGIALQAALTGHLVLSTVHTNDAAGTVARLQTLGESASNISSAVNMAIGQRLVRTLCTKCAKPVPIEPDDLKKLKHELKGVDKTFDLPELSEKTELLYSEGCAACNFTGYKGRIGIFEAFIVNDQMEKFILKSPSISDMRTEAITRGMVPMRQDGFVKVLQGVTTIEEVERVTGEVEASIEDTLAK